MTKSESRIEDDPGFRRRPLIRLPRCRMMPRWIGNHATHRMPFAMDLQLRTGSWITAAADWLIVPVTEPVELAGPWLELNNALGEQLVRLVESEDLTGKLGSTVAL